MKLNKLFIWVLGCLTFASCSDIDDINPSGGKLTSEQIKEINDLVPSRGEATFSGMFTMMGMPGYTFDRGRSDDFGYIMTCLSLDLEASDMCILNSGYNWFSVCGEYTSRYANYANPYIRYASAYNQIQVANEIINSYPADSEDPEVKAKIGQTKAIRAFDYLYLAPYYQFNYTSSKELLCVPLVTEETKDFADNPRATVEEIYEQIIADLNSAIELLEGYKRADKTLPDQQIAYGLRARAHLNMGNYAEAAADAEKALQGYTPASIKDVSTPSFYDMSEKNWMWAINIDASMVAEDGYPTSSSWLSAFSANGYAAATQCVPFINTLLYDKISETDVRKGWWLNEKAESPLLSTISWSGVTGNDIVDLTIPDVKEPFLPYFNVKFGMKSGIGSTINDNDWCLMRVEEMLLIQAEGHAMSDNEPKAREILQNFIKTYRDPNYSINSDRTLQNEIWFQRRVELWGEGFAMNDIMRLRKPVVRFHDNKSSNYPEAFRFNIAPDDGWLLLRFPQDEMNANAAIVDNSVGQLPVQEQNGKLRDGVTD